MLINLNALTPHQVPDRLIALANEFRSVTTDRSFPCVFSKIPFTTSEIYFSHHRPGDLLIPAILEDLKHLCTIIAEQPDALGVIFIEDDHNHRPDLLDDLTLARRIVAAVRADSGQSSAPSEPSPADANWTLTMAGVGLFLNFSTPRHHHRRSRNVGPAFTVIAQARESFDRKGRATPGARRQIRERLNEYDSVPPHPCLGAFGEPGNQEALQYFLGDGLEPLDVTEGEHD